MTPNGHSCLATARRRHPRPAQWLHDSPGG